MEYREWNRLNNTRAVLARSIHEIVVHCMRTDLPPPILQDAMKTVAVSNSASLKNGDYTLNVHHKLFINAPRSFLLDFAARLKDPEAARRHIYAPKMLRDESWRIIYETLAPRHLRFQELLASDRGDTITIDKLLDTPFFAAVVTAYIIF